jgi:multidrug resistance protein
MARKASLLVIFMTVFIDLIGFGIVLPVLPLFAKTYGATGIIAGLIVASYSLMQFLFAPWWGRLSDRIGRRPVLLISTAGACISYILFALACYYESLWGLLASRMAAGVCGANLSVASAYIADVSPPEERSKRMGLIGMAFGLGFIVGPALGALSAEWFGASGPGWTAATICGLNLILAYFVLGESRTPESDPAPPPPRLQQITGVLKRKQLACLMGVFFMATFCFTCFESTFVVTFTGTKESPGTFSFQQTVHAEFDENQITEIRNWHVEQGGEVRKGEPLCTLVTLDSTNVFTAPKSGRIVYEEIHFVPASGKIASIDYTRTIAYYMLVFCGLLGAIIQGKFIGPLVNWLGEKWLIVVGLALLGVSLAWLPLAHAPHLYMLLGALALFSVSSSVYRAPTYGLISLNAGPNEQGEIMGVTQSIGSLARIIGPLFALGLLDVSIRLPYFICAVIAVAAAIVAAFLLKPNDKTALVAEAKLREKEVAGEASKKRINLRGKPTEETKQKKTEGEEAPKRINLRAKPADENEDEKAEG